MNEQIITSIKIHEQQKKQLEDEAKTKTLEITEELVGMTYHDYMTSGILLTHIISSYLDSIKELTEIIEFMDKHKN